MAETGIQAFGRYLRTLRDRRNLSLQETCSLSQAFAETVNKGYLSRCENGKQRLALPKVIPLGRIYGVSADALLERLELDLELDRVGGPETEGLSFAELTKAGTEAVNQGYRWDAYAYLRDAVTRAHRDPLRSTFRDLQEQIACAHMSCGTAASSLGRHRYALHEFLYVKDSGHIGRRFRPIVLERVSQAYRNLNETDLARSNAESAVNAGEQAGDTEYIGYVYTNRANQAFADRQLSVAATFYRKSYEAFRNSGRKNDCAISLNNLAQVYFDLGRYRAARRALTAAEKFVIPTGSHRLRALSHLLMGEIDAVEHHHERAVKHWREAVIIARDLNDKTLRFKAEYLLFKQASDKGDEVVARSIRRRLQRLANWVPKSTPELKEFQQFVSEIAG